MGIIAGSGSIAAGNVSGSGDITAVTSLTTEGTLKVSGSMTFGDACADVATFVSQITGSCDVDVAGNVDIFGATAINSDLKVVARSASERQVLQINQKLKALLAT